MGWKSKYLALTGKITLAKSIITTLAYYAMQTTKIPRTTSHDIDKEQGDLFGVEIDQKAHSIVILGMLTKAYGSWRLRHYSVTLHPYRSSLLSPIRI